MTLQEAIAGHLLSYAPLQAAMGTRLYPGAAPASASPPYATFSLDTSDTDRRLVGGPPPAIVDAQVQFDVWGGSMAQAVGASEALRLALDGYRGPMNGLDVRSASVVNQFETVVPPSDASQEALYRATLFVRFWYNRS